MQLRYLFAIAMLMMLSLQAMAQTDSSLYRSRLEIGVGLSCSFSSGNLSIGKPTDDLISYKKTTFGIATPVVTYFLTKHWGVTGSLSFNMAGNHPKYNNGIYIANGDHYYRDDINNSDKSDDPFVVGLIGVVYRYEWNRWKLNVAATLGVSSFSKYWGGYYLKEKNSNNVYQLIYMPDNTSDDHFTTGLSAKMTYNIGRRLGAFVALQSTYMHPRFDYKEVIENLTINEASTTQVYHYDKSIVSMNICVGVSFNINKRKSKQ